MKALKEKLRFEKMSPRDKRALKLGVIGIVLIAGFLLVTSVSERWSTAKDVLSAAKEDSKSIDMKSAKQRGLRSIVPVFEMPKKEREQKFLFQDKFTEQIKKAGLKSQPLLVSRPVKAEHPGYQKLNFQYSGKCNFDQILKLLTSMNENPYLAAIEEFEMKCDSKNRKEMELTLVVSTYIKQELKK